MKRAQRTIVIAALVFGVVGTLFVYGKAKQRGVVTELLTQNFVAVQFSDGQYCESLKDVQLRNWLFATADVVYLDVPEGSSKELLDQLGRLPSLSRVVIRYQGDDFEHFQLHRNELQRRIAAECAVVAEAFPKLEVLNCWAVAPDVTRG